MLTGKMEVPTQTENWGRRMKEQNSRGRRRFSGDLESVSTAVRTVREAFPVVLKTIGGECRSPRRLGRNWRFDLATLNGRTLDVLECRISGENVYNIANYLRRQEVSLAAAMREGMKLEIQGETQLTDDGTVILDVTKISENFTLSGELHRQDEHTIDALRVAGVPSARTSRRDIHCNDYQRPRFPKQLKRLLVIAPDDSRGLADFKSRVQKSEQKEYLAIDYQPFRWASQAAPEMFQAKLAEIISKGYDLILIIRGGGHWSKLRVFDQPEIALAINRSPVPVATAIGHEPDVSMADRAASFSFVTPTAAGEAIKRELDKRHYIESKRINERASTGRSPAPTSARVSTPANAPTPINEPPAPRYPSLADLNRARAEAAAFQTWARAAEHEHRSDLIELAQRRVRMFSQLKVAAFIAAGVFALLVQQPVVELTGFSSLVLAQVLYPVCSVGISLLAAWMEKRNQRFVSDPATKPMKHPFRDQDDWRRRAKSVRTIRGIRQVIANIPSSG